MNRILVRLDKITTNVTIKNFMKGLSARRCSSGVSRVAGTTGFHAGGFELIDANEPAPKLRGPYKKRNSN